MSQIQLDGISKSFHVSKRRSGRFPLLKSAFIRETVKVDALKEVSFQISPGELIGYIGPNGAGKSTSVKIMSGILTPDTGYCTILGRTPWKQRRSHVAHIGVVFGQRSQLWWDVPVQDTFELLRDIYHIEGNRYRSRLGELVDRLMLAPLLSIPVRQLSLGQRMRCELAASLLHSPEILFLDEPTIGLDAVSKLALRDFLKQENEQNGVTMILTTHDMDDVESLCKRVMVIGHGRLLYDGNLKQLKERYSKLSILKAQVDAGIAMPEIIGCSSLTLKQNSDSPTASTSTSTSTLTITFDPEKLPAFQLLQQLSDKVKLRDISIGEEDIDEIIATMYQELCL